MTPFSCQSCYFLFSPSEGSTNIRSWRFKFAVGYTVCHFQGCINYLPQFKYIVGVYGIAPKEHLNNSNGKTVNPFSA